MGSLSASNPLALGKHGLGLDTGAGVHQVVAEEDLRHCSTGCSILGHVVGTDVDRGGGGFLDELDGSSFAVSAADAIGMTFGSLDDQVDAAVVSGSLIELEGEGLSLAHDGGSAGRHRQTAGDHRPLAYPQDRTGVKRHHRPAGGLD